ncbi:MAG: EI24 domain-containing protein [Pseudomonadota bacterium]
MSRIKGLKEGFEFLIKGFTFLIAHPKLWIWAVIPTILNLLLLAVMLGVFIHYYGDLYGWLSSHLGLTGFEDATAWWQTALNGIIWVLNIIFQIFIVLLSLIILLIVSYAASFIIAGPFNDMLSEHVEVMVTGEEPPPFTMRKFMKDLWRTIRVESLKAAILLAIPIVLFVLSFIPVIGAPLYVVLTFLCGAWDLGFSYADLPFGRKAVPFADRKAFALKHRWALIGLGSGFIIPFFALIFAPPMVVGGTLLYVHTQATLRLTSVRSGQTQAT